MSQSYFVVSAKYDTGQTYEIGTYGSMDSAKLKAEHWARQVEGMFRNPLWQKLDPNVGEQAVMVRRFVDRFNVAGHILITPGK